MSAPDYELVDRVRAWLALLPPHLTIERHGDGEAIYSMRGQPILRDRPASFVNSQHGLQIAFVRDRDSRLWPPVREMLARVQSDVGALLEYVAFLEAENDSLSAEVDRLSPPDPKATSLAVERAMARFRAHLAEQQTVRPQEDDGEPE